jgi:hypothetical protein
MDFLWTIYLLKLVHLTLQRPFNLRAQGLILFSIFYFSMNKMDEK